VTNNEATKMKIKCFLSDNISKHDSSIEITKHMNYSCVIAITVQSC